MRKGFTLIELLIVVLIIAILAAIAVPNFLEFQTRAKVSRVKSDMRSMATAIEAYYVDNNEYPMMGSGAQGVNAFVAQTSQDGTSAGAFRICTFRRKLPGEVLHTLTTPISYISIFVGDTFAQSKNSTFGYRQYPFTWIMISYGPDRDEQDLEDNIPSDHNNVECVAQLTPAGIDTNFETQFVLSVGQPAPEYLVAVGQSGNSLHYDPTNGTTSEGDIVRVKQ